MSKHRLHPRQTAALAWEANTEGDSDGTFRIAPNLYLQKRGNNRSWLMRWDVDRRSNWMGLGAYEDVPQDVAESMVAQYMAVVKDGGDPRRARDEDRIAAGQPVRSKAGAASTKGPMTFRDVARAYLQEHAPRWKREESELRFARMMRQHG